MASIGTLFPTTNASAGMSSTNSQASSSTTGTDSLANQNTFLKLLVAQLQHQDPTQPMEGTTFVTQLAQFSDLQANVGAEQDLNAIAKQYTGATPSATSSAAAGTGSSSSVLGG
jgi:flagellar basal-body rod modification protein FlgD